MGSEFVQVSLHFGSSVEPFWFHVGSILAPFGVNFGTILGQFWVHFGSIWGPWRGPDAEKLRSRIEDPSDQLVSPHFCYFWAQTGGHKGSQNRSKIDQKSMQKSMRNLGEFLHGLGSVFSRLWGCFWDPGPLILSVSCRRDANSQKFVFFHVWVDFFVI